MTLGDPKDTLVVVTGASGFIALHCVRELLERGYRVRGTVRSLTSEPALRRALLPLEPGERLSFAPAELMSDSGWAEALAGARYVLHVASPLPKQAPKDDNDLIVPAREGALRVLRQAHRAGVARVVMTSSVAAVSSGRERVGSEQVFDESAWSDLEGKMTAYERSKTLAERAAWEYVEGEGKPLELVTMNPVFVLGPSLTGSENTSNEIVAKLVRRDMPGVPRLHFSIVDVRDVAKAHVLAMTAPQAAGQRFILGSDAAWLKEIADVLAAGGYPVPTRTVPNFLVHVVSLFDPTVRLVIDRLGLCTLYTSEKARRELGWSGRSMKEMVLDTAKRIAEVRAPR